MTPEERQMLAGLFERIRGAADAPRDSEAEGFISDAVRAQPYAPYLLTQTVIVQDHALRAANERLQQLEEQVRSLQSAGSSAPTSFLGSLGKSLFGAPAAPPSSPSPAWRQSAPPAPAPGGPWGQAPSAPGPFQPQQAPWGAPQQSSGGGFLHGALGTAAGVAGGVLLADSIRGLFSGGNSFGMGSGFGGMGGGFGGAGAGGETIVNNYYGDSADQGAGPDQNDNAQQDTGTDDQDQGFDQSADWSSGDDSGGGDDSYDT